MTVRRCFDVAVAATALALLALPLAAIAAAVKLRSKGPVLFVQTRIGRGGVPFRLYKFRTMTTDHRGPLLTVDGDARVTAIGRVLRRWKIDELPQLWNVVRGDMSIVGPRPEAPQFVALYDDSQRRILRYRPGLAGMAALVYPNEAELLRGQPDPEAAYVAELVPRKIAADLEYEERRTLGSDLRLIVDIALTIFGWERRADRTFRIQPARSTGVAR
jgi:lipopolysaccharide/colanic/teichoic acid biosynthesis glycosyltransferase